MTPDRHWLLTWTTYGTWLPGDSRGFVSNVAGTDGRGHRHNASGQPYTAGQPALHRYAATALAHEPVRLNRPQAADVLDQFRETARFRGWLLFAAAVMANHAHLVVGVAGDSDPHDLLRDFKSYASRRLNRGARRDRWWSEGGSTRKLPDEAAVRAAVEYVREQEYPLAVWVCEPLGERPA